MRILYFSPRDCWPANTGARIRDYRLALHLSKHSDLQYVGMRKRGEAEPKSEGCLLERTLLEREKPYSASKLIRGAIGTDAITVLNYSSGAARSELTRILKSRIVDTVQIEGVHLVKYVALIRAVSPATRIVADWHNIESEIMWRYAETAPSVFHELMARRTAPLIERSEDWFLRSVDAHTVVSERDCGELLRRCGGACIEVVPNGVDVDFFSSTTVSESSRDVLFVGSMDYHANIEAVVWFVHNVWPLVRRANPQLVFRIAGRDPSSVVRALASTDVIVTGTVDDVRPFYERAAVTIAPLRVGGGTRLKILESMAAGVPVVSTTLGAEGIEFRNGEDLILADAPHEIAEAILRTVSDPALAGRLRRNGFDLVRRVYDWSIAGDRLLAVHRRLAQRSQP